MTKPKCPKCGSPHIRDGFCVMCGCLVQHMEYSPKRICPSCGRELPFDGTCCKDCAEAIAKGAVLLKAALHAKVRHDKGGEISCPALARMETDLEKWIEKHERAKEKRRIRDRKYRAEGKKKKRNLEKQRENDRRYRESHKDDPEWKAAKNERERAYYHRRKEQDPEFLAQRNAAAKKRMEDEVYHAEVRRRERERWQNYKENDPEKYRKRCEQSREAKKKYLEKLRSDPEKWAEFLAKARAYRARPERKERNREIYRKWEQKHRLKMQNLRIAAEDEFKKAHFLEALEAAGGTVSTVTMGEG